MKTFTVAFFGHRNFCSHFNCEEKLKSLLQKIFMSNEYVNFLVGRDGEFDMFVTSFIIRERKRYERLYNSLTLTLPYPTEEYLNNTDTLKKYFDDIEICKKEPVSHYNTAIQIRNKNMIDKADLIICFVERKNSSSYQSFRYAVKKKKQIINLNTEGNSFPL